MLSANPNPEIRIDVIWNPPLMGRIGQRYPNRMSTTKDNDIARDRLQAGGHNTETAILQQPVLAIVACKAPKEIADASTR